jgi:hypothetical protein
MNYIRANNLFPCLSSIRILQFERGYISNSELHPNPLVEMIFQMCIIMLVALVSQKILRRHFDERIVSTVIIILTFITYVVLSYIFV